MKHVTRTLSLREPITRVIVLHSRIRKNDSLQSMRERLAAEVMNDNTHASEPGSLPVECLEHLRPLHTTELNSFVQWPCVATHTYSVFAAHRVNLWRLVADMLSPMPALPHGLAALAGTGVCAVCWLVPLACFFSCVACV